MGAVIIIGKLLASLILIGLIVAGAFKASPKTHSPDRRPAAEYTAGFICFIGGLVGLYYVWFA